MLRIENLSVWYGQAQALFGLDMHVQAGELVVLEGLNGAGKSTLLKAVMGLADRSEGRVCWRGQDISTWPSHRRAQAGLGYVAEDRRLFTDLTVQDNLRLAARVNPLVASGSRPSVLPNLSEAQVLDWFPALKPMLARRASQMSGGEQQMLAVARTLLTAPSLLLLDEPCEGIAPVLVERMRDVLLALKHQGMPMLVAEHNRILADHADRVVRIASGRAAAVQGV